MELKVAAKAVIIKNNRALVITRSREEMDNGEFEGIEIIDLPGGIIEPEERVEVGLQREVMEETGLRVEIIKPVLVSDHFAPNLHIVGILFLCRYADGRVKLGPEHDGYYWVTVDELKKMNSSSWAVHRVELAFKEYRNFMRTFTTT